MGSCSRSYCSKLVITKPNFFLFFFSFSYHSRSSHESHESHIHTANHHNLPSRVNNTYTEEKTPDRPNPCTLSAYLSLPRSLFPPNAKQNPRVPHACMHAYLLPPPRLFSKPRDNPHACMPLRVPSPAQHQLKTPEMRILLALTTCCTEYIRYFSPTLTCMQLIPYVYFTYLTYVPAAENFSMGGYYCTRIYCFAYCWICWIWNR